MQNLELIIVDEMSMVTSDFLYKMHYRLAEIFQSDDLFANKSVLLVGDLLQLPPVRNGSRYIFETPSSKKGDDKLAAARVYKTVKKPPRGLSRPKTALC